MRAGMSRPISSTDVDLRVFMAGAEGKRLLQAAREGNIRYAIEMAWLDGCSSGNNAACDRMEKVLSKPREGGDTCDK